MSKSPRTIIDEILEQYESLQHLAQPPDSIALKAVTESLRGHGYVVITKSLWKDLCNRPIWVVKETTDDDTPGS